MTIRISLIYIYLIMRKDKAEINICLSKCLISPIYTNYLSYFKELTEYAQ
jgi:hypothetical protein